MTVKPLEWFQGFWNSHKLFLGVLALALFLRLQNYIGIIRGDDEAYYYLAHQLAFHDFRALDFGAGYRIGLYFPVSVLLRIFGPSEFVATLFPLLASLLLIVFIYSICIIISDARSGLIAAIILATFPLDVFLATNLMPDGPAAMTTTGAFLFFLIAIKAKNRLASIVSASVTAFFVYWSYFVKESTLVTIFALIGLGLYTTRPVIINAFRKMRDVSPVIRSVAFSGLAVLLIGGVVFIAILQPWPLTVNNLELTSYDISSTLLLGVSNPVGVDDLGSGYYDINRPVYTQPYERDVLSPKTEGERVGVFDVAVPLLLASIVFALITRKPIFTYPLIWFFVLFFYLEWGSYAQGFSFPTMFYYLPVTTWIDARNLSVLYPSMVILMGLFLFRLLDEIPLTLFASAAIGVAAFGSLAINSPLFYNQLLTIANFGFLVSIFGSGILLLLIASGMGKRLQSQAFALFFTLVMVVAFLIPVPHFSPADYFKETARRENLRNVLEYLEMQPELPVFGDGALSWLDVYSNFELGYDHLGLNLPGEEARVVTSVQDLYEIGGFKILYGCNKPIENIEDWPVKQFGEDVGIKTCVSLTRIFPENELAEILVTSRNAAWSDPSLENVNIYLSAAMQNRRASDIVQALALYVTYFPERAPIVEASHLLSHTAPFLSRAQEQDLISDYPACVEVCQWEFGPLLTPEIRLEDTPILAIEIDKKTDDPQIIALTTSLKRDTAYILEITLRSLAPFDLVRVNGNVVPDSYPDSWSRAQTWTTYNILIVTPHSSSLYQEVHLELARVFDRGSIEFKHINLIEIES